MQRFIHRFSNNIIGILNGFDRLVLRGTLRKIAYARGMKGFLWHKQVLLKDFGLRRECYRATKGSLLQGCRGSETADLLLALQ